MIKKLEIISNSTKPWSENLETKNIFHSGGKNSQGKTTVIRSMLFAFGFIKTSNFVDGTYVSGLNVVMEYENNSKIWRFDRTSKQLKIKRIDLPNDGITQSFDIENMDDMAEIISFVSKNIFNAPIELVKAALFSNYIDQQYGSHVVNRGLTGVFSKKMRFNINEFANEYNENLRDVALLKSKKQQIKEYAESISIIKGNTNLKTNQINIFEMLPDKNTELNNKLTKVSVYKKIKDEFKAKKNILTFFENNVEQLNLVYKDKQNNIKKLTLDNFSQGIEIKQDLFNEKISNLDKKISDIKKEIELITRNTPIEKDTITKMQKTKNLINELNAAKVEILEKDLNEWNIAVNTTKQEIEKLEDINKAKMWLKLEDNIKFYLKKFADENKALIPFINKMDLIKDLLLKENSKFTTYVGAIRFAISTSFKFAISDFILKEGWDFPIIIDNLLQEEIDKKTKKVYYEILNSRKEQLIVASLNELSFMKKWKFRKEVKRDIFKEKQIALFHTTE